MTNPINGEDSRINRSITGIYNGGKYIARSSNSNIESYRRYMADGRINHR